MPSQQHPSASRRQPQPPAVSWIRMPGYEYTVPVSPAPECPCTKICCADQPCIPAPAPHQQATNPVRPAKRKYQTNPISPNPACISTLPSILPRHRLCPKKPHPAKAAKRGYQTNPIPTASDSAIGRASGRPHPPGLPASPNPAPAPKRQNRTTKQTQS